MNRFFGKKDAAGRAAGYALPLLCACSGGWALQLQYGLAPAGRGQGLPDLLLTAGLYLLFYQAQNCGAEKDVKKRAAALAGLFALLTALCGDWPRILRYGSFSDPALYTCYYINGLIGTFLLYNCGLTLLMRLCRGLPFAGEGTGPAIASGRAFLLCFAGCFSIWFLFLLNQYPGSMESDHMRQLLHALNGYYENRNPLVNSLLVLLCVRAVQALGGGMNAGVFLYSLVQMGLLAAAFGWGVSLLARAGFSKKVLLAVGLFCGLVPYNVFYSYGMWKDTFFTVWLLFTVFALWNVLLRNNAGESVKKRDWAALFACALMASLSRNSGWSALLMTLPFLAHYLKKNKDLLKPACACMGGGIAAALLIMGPLFTLLGVDKTADSITASCVPLQQVAAVIFSDKELTKEQADLIAALADPAAVKAQYDPACADPMKDLLYPSIETLNENGGAYARLWLELGVKHPLTYLRAYRDLMQPYLDPNVSSELAYKWIYENDFGVYRDPKLLEKLDFGYYEELIDLPVLNLLKRPGAMLWLLMILWQVCALRNNRGARLLFTPFFAVVFGLFLTAPVALFRYVYSMAAALPFLVCLPFCGLLQKKKKEIPGIRP